MPGPSDTPIRRARFAELDGATLYDLLRLRSEVFVVEQECVFLDLDGRDAEPDAEHVWLADDAGPSAYLRTLADPDGVHVGRVCTRQDARGRGAAAALVADVVERHRRATLVLNAQSYLAAFYARFGFVVDGPEFLEDGIAHIPMRRRPDGEKVPS